MLAESSLNVLASKKKIDFLKPLQEAQKKHEGFPTINLHLRDKVIENLFDVLPENGGGGGVASGLQFKLCDQ